MRVCTASLTRFLTGLTTVHTLLTSFFELLAFDSFSFTIKEEFLLEVFFVKRQKPGSTKVCVLAVPVVELSVLELEVELSELEVESTTEDFESVSAGSSTVHPFRANAARRMVMYIKENLFTRGCFT